MMFVEEHVVPAALMEYDRPDIADVTDVFEDSILQVLQREVLHAVMMPRLLLLFRGVGS